jgi:hypothetical protein
MGIMTGKYVPFLESDCFINIKEVVEFGFKGSVHIVLIPKKEYYTLSHLPSELEENVKDVLEDIKFRILSIVPEDSSIFSELTDAESFCVFDGTRVEFGYYSSEKMIALSNLKMNIPTSTI